MGKLKIKVEHYADGVVKKKDGTEVKRKDGSPFEKGLLVGSTDGKYPKTVAFTVLNDDLRYSCKNLSSGDDVEVAYDIESREWNGKYFTDVKAWAVETLVKSASTNASSQALQEDDSDDDLPF